MGAPGPTTLAKLATTSTAAVPGLVRQDDLLRRRSLGSRRRRFQLVEDGADWSQTRGQRESAVFDLLAQEPNQRVVFFVSQFKVRRHRGASVGVFSSSIIVVYMSIGNSTERNDDG
jgi:hypothetical protein